MLKLLLSFFFLFTAFAQKPTGTTPLLESFDTIERQLAQIFRSRSQICLNRTAPKGLGLVGLKEEIEKLMTKEMLDDLNQGHFDCSQSSLKCVLNHDFIRTLYPLVINPEFGNWVYQKYKLKPSEADAVVKFYRELVAPSKRPQPKKAPLPPGPRW